jgi:hypothetical protein
VIFLEKRFGDINREVGQIPQMVGANDPKRNIHIPKGKWKIEYN